MNETVKKILADAGITPNPHPLPPSDGTRRFQVSANDRLLWDFASSAAARFVGVRVREGRPAGERQKDEVLAAWFGHGEAAAIELLERFRESGAAEDDVRAVVKVSEVFRAVGGLTWSLKDLPPRSTRVSFYLPRELAIQMRLRAALDETSIAAVARDALAAYLYRETS
jgi:hypothetical protein